MPNSWINASSKDGVGVNTGVSDALVVELEYTESVQSVTAFLMCCRRFPSLRETLMHGWNTEGCGLGSPLVRYACSMFNACTIHTRASFFV